MNAKQLKKYQTSNADFKCAQGANYAEYGISTSTTGQIALPARSYSLPSFV